MADWVEYFSNQTAPANLKETKTAVTEFTASHRAAGRNIVLITVSISLLSEFYCCNSIANRALNAMHNSMDNFRLLRFKISRIHYE